MSRRPLKTPLPTLLCVIACSLLSACAGVRVVTIPTTEPQQLAEPIKAYVYIQTAGGQRVRSKDRVQLYEGEWVLEDPNDK